MVNNVVALKKFHQADGSLPQSRQASAHLRKTKSMAATYCYRLRHIQGVSESRVLSSDIRLDGDGLKLAENSGLCCNSSKDIIGFANSDELS